MTGIMHLSLQALVGHNDICFLVIHDWVIQTLHTSNQMIAKGLSNVMRSSTVDTCLSHSNGKVTRTKFAFHSHDDHPNMFFAF